MEKYTIGEIEQQLFGEKEVNKEFLKSIKKDSRKGVQKLVLKWERQAELKRQVHEQFINMTSFERKYRSEGFQNIAGIDEAGRVI